MFVHLVSVFVLALAAGPSVARLAENKEVATRELQGPVCDRIASLLTGPRADCHCGFNFQDFTFQYDCTTAQMCLTKSLCATPKMVGVLGPGLALTGTTCLDLKLPNPTAPTQLCVSATHCSARKGQVCDCTATVNGQTCNSCSVCPGGLSVNLNCNNLVSFLPGTTSCLTIPL